VIFSLHQSDNGGQIQKGDPHMSDLDVVAKKFKEWRGNRRYYRYPKPFWDGIQQLAKHHKSRSLY
jgi:hypothetical protein